METDSFWATEPVENGGAMSRDSSYTVRRVAIADRETGSKSAAVPSVGLLEHLDYCRLQASQRLDQRQRSALGQFFTPKPVARLMASMMSATAGQEVKLLDPGAGIGTLFAAVVEELCVAAARPKKITVTAYEVEPALLDYLHDTAEMCRALCESHGVEFDTAILQEDFIESAVAALRRDMFSLPVERFTHAILNPPYHKIQSDSRARKLLSSCGVETGNLYTAFMALSSKLLAGGGQMVSITPRSFCNGSYFRPFRRQFLQTMSLERLHVFHSRSEAFRDDDVLQENLILKATKGQPDSKKIQVSSSVDADDELMTVREVPRSQVVGPADEDAFIHIVTDEMEGKVVELAESFKSTLGSLGLEVSTGRVVHFRATDFIRDQPCAGSAPLIYPAHFKDGYVSWPQADCKKPNAIVVTTATQDLLVPSQHYVLVKRFSAKEERKRVVAAVYDTGRIPATQVGLENHLNYFHKNHAGMPLDVAKGLAAYLNSTFVDTLFRHFSGHTQVNAADLRKLPYPKLEELEKLGKHIGEAFPAQEDLDRLVEQELLDINEHSPTANPMAAKTKAQEALSILRVLGFPRAQLNERSALTLLSLLDLTPTRRWAEAGRPLRGITPMMEFFSEHYGKSYKPNTRETVRRQTVHQFLEAGLIIENPDEPTRPTNSPKAVYQIESGALELLRTFGSAQWGRKLRSYLASRRTLAQRYAREREMRRIPILLGEGKTITLSPGGQNVLVSQIISEFAPRFTPGGQLLYVGDTDEKFAHFDRALLARLGVSVEAHGKMPDVIVHHSQKNWLVLIEAVTSHGPVDPKRRDELKKLFGGSSAGLVFVTAFLTRKAMIEYLDKISWETEVWIAEAPSHLIHFNGERFLGPYES